MDVHLRDLRYFEVLARERHFGRAADELGISQPALSKQIRSLEDRLGATLVDRSTTPVGLTPAGLALDGHLPGVLGPWREACAALEAAARGQQQRLVIGLSTGVGRGIIPAIRKELAGRDGGYTLALTPVLWDDTTAGLDARPGPGSPDAAFVWLPLPDEERFEWVVVAEEPRVVALSACHRLADRSEIDVAELLDDPILALPEGSGPLRDHFLAVEARGGTPPRVAGTITNVESTAEDVASGVGICFLAAGNSAFLTHEGLVIRSVRGLGPSRLALAWRRGDQRPALAALRDACAAVGGSAAG